MQRDRAHQVHQLMSFIKELNKKNMIHLKASSLSLMYLEQAPQNVALCHTSTWSEQSPANISSSGFIIVDAGNSAIFSFLIHILQCQPGQCFSLWLNMYLLNVNNVNSPSSYHIICWSNASAAIWCTLQYGTANTKRLRLFSKIDKFNLPSLCCAVILWVCSSTVRCGAHIRAGFWPCGEAGCAHFTGQDARPGCRSAASLEMSLLYFGEAQLCMFVQICKSITQCIIVFLEL